MASPEEMLALKTHVQRNTADLQDYLKDLGGWTEEMEQKDNQLKKKTMKKSKNKEPRQEVTTAKPEERISSYDYDKWDKFDADRVLQEIDTQAKITEIIDDNEVVETAEQLVQRAVAEKERGNDRFRRGDYESAVDCYTRGIQCDPRNAALPANRAMALLKLSRNGEAEADCTLAISLDPTYVKAFQRRATARANLKRLKEAISDYEQVLELEPKNKQAKVEIEKIRRLQNAKKVEILEPKSAASFSDNIKAAFTKKPVEKSSEPVVQQLEPGQILPIHKAPHERSTKPLKPIQITDARPANFLDVVEEAKPRQLDITSSEESNVLMSPVKQEERVIPKPPPKIETIQETASSVVQDTDMEEVYEPKAKHQELIESELDRVLTFTSYTGFVPKSAAEFMKAWRSLSPAKRSAYLLQMTGNDFPKIFKHCLEPELFSEILSVLGRAEFGGGKGVQYLGGLCRVPRVTTTLVMFLSDEEVAVCRRLLTDDGVKMEAKELQRLKKVFGVK